MDLCIQSHCHHAHAITAIVFFGHLVVTGSLDGTVSLINTHFSEVIDRITVPAKCGGVTCVSASSEASTGTFIAGTASGRLVKLSFSDSTVSCASCITPSPVSRHLQAFDCRAHSGSITRVDATTLNKSRCVRQLAYMC